MEGELKLENKGNFLFCKSPSVKEHSLRTLLQYLRMREAEVEVKAEPGERERANFITVDLSKEVTAGLCEECGHHSELFVKLKEGLEMTMGACLTSIQAKMKVESKKNDVETEYPIQEGTIVKEALRMLRTTQPRMVSENLQVEETSDDKPVVLKIEVEEMEAEREDPTSNDLVDVTDTDSEQAGPSSSNNLKRMSSNLYSGAEAPAIGIDLGTTNSSVSVFQNGKVEIIANSHGNCKTPNYVAFTDTEHLIGEEAKNQLIINPRNTTFDMQRLIGRKFKNPSVQYDMKHWPFVVVNDGGNPKVQVEFKGERKILAPEEITAMLLTRMKGIAEAYLGKTVTHAVITLPVYFNYGQKEAIKVAARIAGLNVLGLLAASTAAGIAYALGKNSVH